MSTQHKPHAPGAEGAPARPTGASGQAAKPPTTIRISGPRSLVADYELIDAYMALRPGWTTRMAHSPHANSHVWIETFESERIAFGTYTPAQRTELGLGDALYARTFVAVSVAEGFAMLAGGAS